MLIENQMVETTWMPANKQWYIDKGYHFTKCRDKLTVCIEDLMPSSQVKVEVICDYCGTTIEKQYHLYLKGHESGKDCCYKCLSKKNQELFQQKYGVNNPFQLSEVKEKIKQTCLEKYGVENPSKNQEVKEKIFNTNLEKYGSICSLQSPEVKAKAEQTWFDKYGVTNVFASKEIQEKIKETNKIKYGDENIARAPIIAEKIRQRNIDKYGVPYTTQAPEVIAKMRKSLMQNGKVATSKPEKELCNLLHEVYGDKNCIDGFALDRINMDCLVKIDNCLVDIEYDGAYWHKDREEYDKRRNYWVIDQGYRVLRIKGNTQDLLPTKEEIIKAIDYLVKDNHHLTYIDMNI